ncbi:hypothetical protein HYZ41_03330 [archaeon]|nr:hypothetical protein [archaeon]
MKGVSIALETVVYIILAVIVLTVLLYFLTSQAGPAQVSVNDERTRTTLCGKYVYYDYSCTDSSKVEKDVPNPTILNELTVICKKLESACNTFEQQKCIQRCCRLFCPTTT